MVRRNRSVVSRCVSAHQHDAFERFETLDDFLTVRERLGNSDYGGSSREKWAGGTFAETIKLCRDGDLSAVAEAEKLADMICDSVDVSGLVPSWRLDVSGAFPCVPEFLAGSPECMFNQCPVPSVSSPIDICADLIVPAKVTPSKLQRRGVCIMAAVMAISRVRPVNLWCYSSCYFARPLVRLSSPLDVSEVCAVVSRPAFSRLMFCDYCYLKAKAAGHPASITETGMAFAPWAHSQAESKRALVDNGRMSPDCLVLSTTLDGWAEMGTGEFINVINRMIRNVAAVDSSTAAA